MTAFILYFISSVPYCYDWKIVIGIYETLIIFFAITHIITLYGLHTMREEINKSVLPE